MASPRNKPQHRNGEDSTGVTYYSLLNFLARARTDLDAEGKEDAAFYFGQFEDWLRHDYVPSKSLVYESKILGL